jgi:GNAT superfamily N-acetyltransferase
MEITKLRASKLDEAAALLVRAFFDYPVWTWLEPDEAKRRTLMPWFMRASLSYGVISGETYVAGDPLLGVAMWEPPGKVDADLEDDPERDRKTGWDEFPQRMGAEATARFDAMIETQRPVRERVSRGQPVWYLPWVGVEPSAQRNGVGRALLEDMFARTDASGMSCMLETEKQANVPYYELHGFVVAEAGTLPLGGPSFWTMRRDPMRR